MRGRKLGRGGNVGLNSGARRRCEGEREGGAWRHMEEKGGGSDTGTGTVEVGTDRAARQHMRGGNRGGARVGRSGGKRKENGSGPTE
jgi:hypothetical protein